MKVEFVLERDPANPLGSIERGSTAGLEVASRFSDGTFEHDPAENLGDTARFVLDVTEYPFRGAQADVWNSLLARKGMKVKEAIKVV